MEQYLVLAISCSYKFPVTQCIDAVARVTIDGLHSSKTSITEVNPGLLKDYHYYQSGYFSSVFSISLIK